MRPNRPCPCPALASLPPPKPDSLTFHLPTVLGSGVRSLRIWVNSPSFLGISFCLSLWFQSKVWSWRPFATSGTLVRPEIQFPPGDRDWRPLTATSAKQSYLPQPGLSGVFCPISLSAPYWHTVCGRDSHQLPSLSPVGIVLRLIAGMPAVTWAFPLQNLPWSLWASLEPSSGFSLPLVFQLLSDTTCLSSLKYDNRPVGQLLSHLSCENISPFIGGFCWLLKKNAQIMPTQPQVRATEGQIPALPLSEDFGESSVCSENILFSLWFLK